MLHLIQMIKKYWIYVLFVFSVVVFVTVEIRSERKKPEIKIINVNGGWGYEVYVHKKLYISQTTIPAIDAKKPFVNKEQAAYIAQLVVKKMIAKKGMPTITLKELDSLGITK